MNLLELVLFILVFIAVLYGVYFLWLYIIRKRSAKMVETADVEANIRRVQVIDVREPAEFEASHILGARNIPISQFKMRYVELRQDKEIYLYDDSLNYASRAANILRSNGYRNVFILKGGFSKWLGKTKSNL